jgi:hypothetical protein
MKGAKWYCVKCQARVVCQELKLGKCEIVADTWPVKPHLTYNKRLKMVKKGTGTLRPFISR